MLYFYEHYIKKWSFALRISSVNVSKSTVSWCKFSIENFIFCAVQFANLKSLFILKIIDRKKISFIFPLKLWKLLLLLFFFSFFNDRFSCGMVKWRNFMFTKIHEKCMYSTSGSDSFHGQRRYDITWPFQHLPTGRTY